MTVSNKVKCTRLSNSIPFTPEKNGTYSKRLVKILFTVDLFIKGQTRNNSISLNRGVDRYFVAHVSPINKKEELLSYAAIVTNLRYAVQNEISYNVVDLMISFLLNPRKGKANLE